MTIFYHDLDDGTYQKFKFNGIRVLGFGNDEVYVEAYQLHDSPTVYVQEVRLSDLRSSVRVFCSEGDFLKYVAENGYESGLL